MKRSRGVLLYARRAAMGCVAALILVAGFWSSWGTAQHVILAKGRDHGTLTVASCAGDTCTGPYTPSAGSEPHSGLSIDKSTAAKKGEELPVVVRPGSDEAIRTGWAGVLHAWVPLGGALVLAALVIGGGLRMTRTAWVAGGAGAALLAAAFLAL
ncbi:hypothetical protein OG204_14440 [Streptomyces sp. NBC_01387]|uniref:hypothetical protein n=1 Tax=unclassified Streptomyces TaxID=2593676 RepID=UPI002023EB8E|nr:MULTISPECIES: hypothetical protein [unclassified Streptomyces]MCX4550461.1 hypothetical protein [Streptomyces sp. NBC_01500]WSC21914.1 hypothetical protein OIE60_20725 [Streptomyces sp. NBC_01766]WSV55869.1 hypothetical protein OG282_20370 [Streptomyces sp. NBC_01014]